MGFKDWWKGTNNQIKYTLFGITGGFIFLIIGFITLLIGIKTENELLLFYPFKIADIFVSKLFPQIPIWEGFFYVSIAGLIINFFTGFFIGLIVYYFKNKK